MRISEISVHRPILALVVSLLLVVVGLVALTRLWSTIREFPDINPPIVSIDTRYLGASAEILETKVTQPIEERVAGLEGIETLKSTSSDGRSRINLEFDLGRDVDAAANDVRDRVARVLSNLPDQADPPEIVKADSSAEPILYVNIASDKMTTLELSDYVERNIADRFAAVPGIARVQLSGDRRYAMRVWLDAEALAARRLTVNDVESALRRENVQLPAGRLESRVREFVLNTATGLTTPDDFRQLVVGRSPDGYLVRLGEVAEIALAAENERTISRTLGVAGISIGLEPQSNANALTVAAAAHAEVAAINAELPAGTQIGTNVDRSEFIKSSMREVLIALGISVLLVLVVIYAFLGSWRATLIPAVTIPVSIIGACAAIYAMGFTINTFTLLGIVLAIGLVVDDAIVMLENIYRRIERGENSLLAAIDGSREIGFAVVATTLVLAAVFLPISFLTGRIGRLFGEFGFTLAASILFSCLVALTLTPMMTAQLFQTGAVRSRISETIDRLFHRMSERYRSLLDRALGRPWLIVGGALAIFAVAIGLFTRLPEESTPQDDRGVVRVMLFGPEGASLDYMDGYAARLEDIFAAEAVHGDIARYQIRVPGFGGAAGSEVNRAMGMVVLKHWSQRERTARQVADSIQREVALLPGVRASVTTPSAFNWGGQEPLQAVIMGPDYATLAAWRDQLIERASTNPGLVNLDSNYKERKPQMDVAVDRNRAADLGLSLDAIARTLETMLASRTATTFIMGGREYDVILQGRSEDRSSPTSLENLYVRSDSSGELVPLASVVQLNEAATATQLNRFNRLRSITISAGLAGDYSMGDAVRYFRQIVDEELPPTAKLDFDGESREYLKASQSLYWTFFGALLIVFLVLAAQFESFVLPFVIMTTVPLAIVGAIGGMWLYGISINVFSQIAIVMLIGLAAKNGVLIVEFSNQLRDRGVAFKDAIVQASVTRLRPVLMTSLCSAFGALPLLLATGAGAESRQPIGVVVVYGVLISMVLTLLVVPAVYALVAQGTRTPQYWTRAITRMRGQTVHAH
jgi:multidrug efflux pump